MKPVTKEPFYVTTSIPYTNAPPHIGHAFEFIQADAVARYQRQNGKDVFFLTGTDEHGLKTLRAAEAAGKDAMAFASETSGIFKELLEALLVSNDGFIRTTDETLHRPAVERLWKQYEAAGDIYKKKYRGLYCPGCEAFKTEKEVLGGNCAIHLKPVEEIEEENYFFRLSKYLPRIKEAIVSGELEIIPGSKKNEVIGMIDGGLDDVSFSRSKDKYWSFPVPGDDSQVIYVWADALPNYLSALGYAEDGNRFKKHWPAQVHCIGKDIVKFHALYWPAMLMSAELPLPKSIFVHGHITMGGQKMSKSLGNVVDPFELVGKYGADAVRYYLLREIPATEDGDFTYEKFEIRYNADLAGGIGNLLARVLGIAKSIEVGGGKISQKTEHAITVAQGKVSEAMAGYRFNDALAAIWELVGFCDKYINDEKLWETKSPAVTNDLFVALDAIAGLLAPFLPRTAETMKAALVSKNSTSLFPRLDRE